MKPIKYTILSTCMALLSALLFSCSAENDDTPQTFTTTVKGHVADMQRGIPVANYKIAVESSKICQGSDGGTYICAEIVASVLTDANGNYEITFEAAADKEYGIDENYDAPYISEDSGISGAMTKGALNIRNINAWKPAILKLNLHITNNNHSPLRVDNEVIGTDIFGWQSTFSEPALDTIIYMPTKPDADVQLQFHYVTGSSNADFHIRKEILHSSLDTLNLEYNVDCSAF
ncbi:hypothetical protein [Flavobacterium sp. 3HN19-14]|uniref:hypothetical protein n=1 Tax=Flavobacterium sp. 3HN19-14 TaxID=3448133 RepID=UPI003EE05D37